MISVEDQGNLEVLFPSDHSMWNVVGGAGVRVPSHYLTRSNSTKEGCTASSHTGFDAVEFAGAYALAFGTFA